MKLKRTVLLGTSILLASTATSCLAESSLEKSLHWLNNKIHQATEHLTHITKNRNDLQQNLKDIELHMSRLSQERMLTQKQLKDTQQNIITIKLHIQKTRLSLQQQQKELAALINMEYRLGKQSNLRLALQDESIQTRQRLTSYLNIINQKQSELAHSIDTKLQDLSAQQANLEASEQNYQSMLEKINQTEEMLKKAMEHRLTIIKRMEKSIISNTTQLQTLQKQKSDLTAAITQANQDIPVTQNLSFPYDFGQHMHWPTQGMITQPFGMQIDHSQLTTDGIVIKASMGQPVHAIANGVVVFSKWMPGYGLMMIINHGHGYMSLYGRNQQLLYHNGQVVQKGALIATVGNTGGFKDTGLYFAIRHNGIPVNPKKYM